MPTTQLNYAAAELDAAKHLQALASVSLSAAQTRLKGTRSALTAAANGARQTQDTLALLRDQLKVAPVSAGTAALLATIEAKTAELNALAGVLAQLTAREREERADERFWAARAEASAAEVLAATTAHATAKKDTERRTAVLAKVTSAQADATTASGVLAGVEFSTAEAKFTAAGSVPPELYSRAKQRFALSRARVAAARALATGAVDAVNAKASADLGLDGDERQTRAAFQAVDLKLSAFVTSSGERLARARTVLQQLGALTGNAITPDEANKAKAGLAPTGPIDAATLARVDAVFTAQGAFDTAQAAYRAAFATARASDPTLSDTELDALAAVSASKATLDGAPTTNLAAARAALTASDLDHLRGWFLSLSDANWRRLHDFFEAEAALKELQAATPGTWSTDLSTTEGAWGDAATALSRSRRSLDQLAATVTLAEEKAGASSDSSPLLQLSAVRGDLLFER